MTWQPVHLLPVLQDCMGCKQAANVPVSALLAGEGQTDLLSGSVSALVLSLETKGRILLASVAFSLLLQGQIQAPTATGQTPECCMSQAPGSGWDTWPVCHCDWRDEKAACLTARQDSRRCAQLAEHCPACVFLTYLQGFMTQKFVFMSCKKGNYCIISCLCITACVQEHRCSNSSWYRQSRDYFGPSHHIFTKHQGVPLPPGAGRSEQCGDWCHISHHKVHGIRAAIYFLQFGIEPEA